MGDPVQWVLDTLREREAVCRACGGSGHRYSPLEDARRGDLWTGTQFFFKKGGGRTPKAGGREIDGRTWDEMPERQAVPA